MSSKQQQANEHAALLPTSAPPPYSEHASSSSPSSFRQHQPQRPSHALGPTPVAALPPPPPSLYAQQRTAHARADARARRRFCGALCCAGLLWLVMGAVFGAVVGEEVVRRGRDGRFSIRRAAARAKVAEPESVQVQVHSQPEGEENGAEGRVWVDSDSATSELAGDVIPPRPDYAAA
ncbi:hypothetical protein JCM10450v2_005013 [Rhodotorula kratochvilovae]